MELVVFFVAVGVLFGLFLVARARSGGRSERGASSWPFSMWDAGAGDASATSDHHHVAEHRAHHDVHHAHHAVHHGGSHSDFGSGHGGDFGHGSGDFGHGGGDFGGGGHH